MSTVPELTVGGYRVAEELFTLGYARDCGPFGCNAACCGHGAYIDVEERALIVRERSRVASVMTADQPRDPSAWFEAEERVDADYPSGKCVGTVERERGCVFLDRNSRCSLQVAALAAGFHKWAWKPRYCVLFPIDVLGDLIRFDPRLQNQRPCCSIAHPFTVPLFRACREELEYLLGDAGFVALEQHYLEHYANAASDDVLRA